MAEFILKDWYGKEQTFDKETIYVQGKDGELMPFTHGEGNPVIEPLNVTQNGTYEVPDGVDGFNPVSVNVPAPEIKLQEKTITENGTFTADAGFDGLGKVTVEVAGSGGGSLPAGGYWKGEASRTPYGGGSFFQYNGKRYWYGKSAYNDTKYDVYLYENDVYTLVATDVYDRDITYAGTVEHNGKIHFLGYDTTNHYTWDGVNSFEKQKSLPATTTTQCFVMDGDLFIKTKSSGFHKWIEGSDTWEAVTVSNCPTTSYEGLAVIGRKIYIAGYKKIYEVDWDTKTCTLLETECSDGVSGKDSVIAFGRYLYCLCSGSIKSELCALYKYHIDNKTYEFVAKNTTNMSRLYLYNGRIYVYGYNDYHNLHQALYEVTE